MTDASHNREEPHAPEPGALSETIAHDEEGDGPGEDAEAPAMERAMFAHPEWMLGVVLVIAVVMLLLGILGHPLWLLIGSPFILVLAVWIWAKSVERSRRRDASSDRP